MSERTLPAVVQRFDEVASLTGATVQEKAVLWCIARFSTWQTGEGARPSTATIAAWTGVSERVVVRLLRSLVCDPLDAAAGRCLNRRARWCRHRGWLALERLARSGQPAEWGLRLEPAPHGVQLRLAEVGAEVVQSSRRTSCSTPGCRRPHHARGLCDACYRRLLRSGSADAARVSPVRSGRRRA